jgi:hypothetical protein
MVYQYKQYWCYRNKNIDIFAYSLAELIKKMKILYNIEILTYLN